MFFDPATGGLVWRWWCIVCMDPELPCAAAEMPEHYRRAKPTRVHEPIIIRLPLRAAPQPHLVPSRADESAAAGQHVARRRRLHPDCKIGY
eukprot:1080776-Prymnesium_polylepis.1